MIRLVLIYVVVNIFVFALYYYGGLAGITLITYYECRNSEQQVSCLRDNLYITLYRIHYALNEKEKGKEVILNRCRTRPSPVCKEIKNAKEWI